MSDQNPEHILQLRERKIANLINRVATLEHEKEFIMYLLNSIIKYSPGLKEKIIEMEKERAKNESIGR
jgi:hypothetical protein